MKLYSSYLKVCNNFNGSIEQIEFKALLTNKEKRLRTQGRSGLSLLIMGSVSQHGLLHSPVLVMIVSNKK